MIQLRRPGQRFIRIVLIASVALVAAGCGLVPGATEALGLDFQYMRHAGSGFLDQVLSIDNHRGSQAAIPTLTIHALDNAGNELPGVSVEGLFGSTRKGRIYARQERAYLREQMECGETGTGASPPRAIQAP